MPETLTPAEAAARFEPTDTLGIPLGPGQPGALVEAMGERDDWRELRVGGGLLTVWSELWGHEGVHYLSGFFGPLERALRDQGANISFAPADFRRFEPILEAQAPRVMATMACPPDDDGWCSLSLHAGATTRECRRAGADPDRLLIVETSAKFPRTFGILPDHRHALHVDEIDVLVESDREPLALPEPEPSDTDRAIAEHCAELVPPGSTLQTGIGAVPSQIAALLADGEGGGYGIHSEMFTTGLMTLCEAGKVTNEKGFYDGVSVATFAAGTPELYEWLDGNEDVAFLPVELVNSQEAIAGQPLDGHDQRGDGDRHPRPGDRRHDRRGAVLGDRRPRGLHRRAVPRARGPLAALHVLDDRDRRRDALADRPLVRRGRRDHDAAPPGGRRRDRARRRRAPGQDDAPARRGARRGRPPGLPRRAPGGGGARLGRARSVSAGLPVPRPLRASPRAWLRPRGRGCRARGSGPA